MRAERFLTQSWPLLLILACSSSSGGGGGLGGQSVLTRAGSETREGFFIQPKLTKAAGAKMAMDTDFQAAFDGPFWGSPLYVENGPQGKGAFLVASNNNNVYALDETTGKILWTHSIGTA